MSKGAASCRPRIMSSTRAWALPLYPASPRRPRRRFGPVNDSTPVGTRAVRSAIAGSWTIDRSRAPPVMSQAKTAQLR